MCIRDRFLIGLAHVGPDRVATHPRTFDAAQDCAHRRFFAPRCVAVPGVLVKVRGGIEILVDTDESRMIRIASSDRVVLERTETLGERDMLGLADHLVPQEQYL